MTIRKDQNGQERSLVTGMKTSFHHFCDIGDCQFCVHHAPIDGTEKKNARANHKLMMCVA